MKCENSNCSNEATHEIELRCAGMFETVKVCATCLQEFLGMKIRQLTSNKESGIVPIDESIVF